MIFYTPHFEKIGGHEGPSEGKNNFIQTIILTFSLKFSEVLKKWVIRLEVEKEYERIKGLFDGTDEKQLQLLDGAFWECARLRVELNELGQIIKETGLIKINPKNKSMQKELPVSKLVVKVRANYLNYLAKLSNILGKNVDDDFDDLEEFED